MLTLELRRQWRLALRVPPSTKQAQAVLDAFAGDSGVPVSLRDTGFMWSCVVGGPLGSATEGNLGSSHKGEAVSGAIRGYLDDGERTAYGRASDWLALGLDRNRDYGREVLVRGRPARIVGLCSLTRSSAPLVVEYLDDAERVKLTRKAARLLAVSA